jgi:F-type H+-transporting ATPase subunit b
MTAIRKTFAAAALAAGMLLATGALGGEARAQAPQAEVPRQIEPPVRGAGEAASHGAAHGDPSTHFNFFGSPAEHYGKDITGGPYGDGKNENPATGEVVPGEEEPMSAPFIFMILNFVILLALLSKLGRPAARKLAAERHDQIKTALEDAAKLRKQAADKLAEYDAQLKALPDEIAKIVAGIRADAEADKQRILEAAERSAAQMKRDAELHIAAEIELARRALTREVTAAATAAAERILREKMTPGDQQTLVGAFIGELQGTTRKEAR